MPATKKHDLYFELVERLPLKPITSARGHRAALRMIDELVDIGRLPKLAADYLEVLSGLVERYEEATDPMDSPTEPELLAFLMEQHGVTARALAAETGIGHTTISAVLNDKRRLTRDHVGLMAEFFSVSPAVFFDCE